MYQPISTNNDKIKLIAPLEDFPPYYKSDLVVVVVVVSARPKLWRESSPGKESLPGGRAKVRPRTVCSSHWWSSSVAMEATRRYLASCINDHLVGLKSRGA